MSQGSIHAVVYGPLKTRRLGVSLGVNPMPSARGDCGPDCLFCRTGAPASVPIVTRPNQPPSPGVIVTSAARRIIEMSKAGEKLDSITLAGNGDPTRHPAMLEITENLRDLRNKWFAKTDLCLITTLEDLALPDLRHAVSVFDRAIVRLEWGSAKVFSSMTGRPSTDLKRLMAVITGLDKVVVQANFVRGPVDNSSDREVKSWIKKLEEVRPREVHVLTPEDEGSTGRRKGQAVPAARLEAIAADVTERTGIPAVVVSREAQPV